MGTGQVNWAGKRVLVTGAGGFIGSHLSERLAALGARTRCFVHYRADGSWGWLEEATGKRTLEVVAGDLTDRDCVLDAVRDCEIVFHLGALIPIPYSYRAPLSFIRTNVEGTLNVLQAARTCGVGRVVHTSTSEVYGTARTVPITESHALQAQSPYAASKIGADKIAEACHLSFGVPVVTVRPFNTYGPRQSARAVIPTIIAQCLTGGPVRLGNLDPTRDLNFVSDTVEGFIRAASVDQAVGHTVNLGSGREISIRDLAHLIGSLVGKPLDVVADQERLRPAGSEVERLLADNSKAASLLGWTPSVSLEEGLERTIEWIRHHLNRYRPDAYAV